MSRCGPHTGGSLGRMNEGLALRSEHGTPGRAETASPVTWSIRKRDSDCSHVGMRSIASKT